MRIGFVLYGDVAQTSGGYRYNRKLRDFLVRKGDTVDVISLPAPDTIGGHGDIDDEAYVTQLDRQFDILLVDGWTAKSLWQAIERLDTPESIIGLVHLLRSGPGAHCEEDAHSEQTFLESVDGAICTSRDTEQRVLDRATLPTIVAPPSGRIEDAALSEQAIRTRATRSGPLHVLFVGNVLPRKGVTDLVKAVSMTDPQITLTVIGDVESDPAYAAKAQSLGSQSGMADRMQFCGRVTERELTEQLRSCHVLALPSLYEGFGMVILESMEYGVVPIGSTVGGADEIVTHGETGYLVDPEDPEQLCHRLRTLQHDREQLAEIGIRAADRVARHPSWEETFDGIRPFLQERIG